VGVAGVLAGHHGQPDDRVFVDADEAAGLSDATAFLEVLQDGEGLVVGELAAEQGGALTFGEALLAGAAGETAELFVFAVSEGDAEVVEASLAVVLAAGVLAAEGFQVVHRSFSSSGQTKKVGQQLESA
jgi:hypothetical protein